MSATISIPFAIGQPLWWIGSGYQEEWITCPECAGTRVITMIQGNGEQFAIECAACSLGWEPARGAVKRTFYQHKPTPFIPKRVDISGGEIHYSEASPDASGYSFAYVKDLFASEVACADRCAELNEERTKAAEEQALAQLASKRKNLAWSVHYWGGQVKALERDLERVRTRLGACKERKRIVA